MSGKCYADERVAHEYEISFRFGHIFMAGYFANHGVLYSFPHFASYIVLLVTESVMHGGKLTK